MPACASVSGCSRPARSSSLCVLPLPFSTVAPAVVWLPDEAQVRPEVDGFVTALPVRDGEAVEPGQLLAVLDNPELSVERDKLGSRLDGLRAEQFRLMLRDPGAADNLARDIERTEAELARALERIGQLEVRAQTSGKLVMPRQADLVATYARHGTTLGYVLSQRRLARARRRGRGGRVSGAQSRPAVR